MIGDPTDRIDAWLDGELSDAEAAKLELWLSADAGRMERFVEASVLHRALREAIVAQHSECKPDDKPITVSLLSVSIGDPPESAWGNAVGYVVAGWPVAYLVATVILGIGLLVGGLVHVSQPEPLGQQVASSPAPRPSVGMNFVGRITGMVDCQWADPQTEAFNGASVPLGRRYALASGLMEITYDTGAKVILQGPVTYEVESAAGGYLLVGKLTAKVEKHEEGRTGNEELLGSRSSFRIPYSYFAVRTPTATVTDLGTEFGVEVDRQGATTSHVFQGAVVVRIDGSAGTSSTDQRVLYANESVKVTSGGSADGSGASLTILSCNAASASFVREIIKTKIKVLDLVDVVAGGDGFSGRRNRGIHPLTGAVSDILPKRAEDFIVMSDGGYHGVEALPFVDGVFIPDSRRGAVQVDSTGHTFDQFVATAGITGHYFLWAGGPVPAHSDKYPDLVIPTRMRGIDFGSRNHGVLFLHANVGITFDLEAVRRANRGYTISHFLAIAGNAETASADNNWRFADMWVLVDGQDRYHRREITNAVGSFSVTVPVRDGDRFLTLVSTDSGDGIGSDWILFGDPRLELVRMKAADGDTHGTPPGIAPGSRRSNERRP